MTIDFFCPQCRKLFRLKLAAAGKKVKCDGCGTKIRVPDSVASLPGNLGKFLTDELVDAIEDTAVCALCGEQQAPGQKKCAGCGL